MRRSCEQSSFVADLYRTLFLLLLFYFNFINTKCYVFVCLVVRAGGYTCDEPSDPLCPPVVCEHGYYCYNYFRKSPPTYFCGKFRPHRIFAVSFTPIVFLRYVSPSSYFCGWFRPHRIFCGKFRPIVFLWYVSPPSYFCSKFCPLRIFAVSKNPPPQSYFCGKLKFAPIIFLW